MLITVLDIALLKHACNEKITKEIARNSIALIRVRYQDTRYDYNCDELVIYSRLKYVTGRQPKYRNYTPFYF